MNINEAKSDFKRLLQQKGVPFAKLSAKTVSFEGFGYGRSIFVTVHGAHMKPSDWAGLQIEVRSLGKPSEGGYIIENTDTKWL